MIEKEFMSEFYMFFFYINTRKKIRIIQTLVCIKIYFVIISLILHGLIVNGVLTYKTFSFLKHVTIIIVIMDIDCIC